MEISSQVELEQSTPPPKGRYKPQGGKSTKPLPKRPGGPLHSAIDKSKLKAPVTQCTTCGKQHSCKCIHLRDLDKEQQKLNSACKLKAAITKGSTVEAVYVSWVRELEELDDNEDSDAYSYLSILTALPTSSSTQSKGHVILAPRNQCLDSGSPVDITSNPAFARMTGCQVKLSGVTGNAQITELALVSCPIRTYSCSAVRLKTCGPGLYLSSSSDNILSMALLMKAGHDVQLKAESPQDPEDWGCIYLADGDTVCLLFVNDVWRLPLATDDDSASSFQLEQLDTSFNRQLEVSLLPLELSATEQVQVYHNAWVHPSNSKLEHIVRFRHCKGFPHHFLRTLKHFQCKVCRICKGERSYSCSKRVQEIETSAEKLQSKSKQSHCETFQLSNCS
eukprot:1586581-Rhodomonas_salina.1